MLKKARAVRSEPPRTDDEVVAAAQAGDLAHPGFGALSVLGPQIRRGIRVGQPASQVPANGEFKDSRRLASEVRVERNQFLQAVSGAKLFERDVLESQKAPDEQPSTGKQDHSERDFRDD